MRERRRAKLLYTFEIGVNGRVVCEKLKADAYRCPVPGRGLESQLSPSPFSAPLDLQTNPFRVSAIQPIISRSFHAAFRGRWPGRRAACPKEPPPPSRERRPGPNAKASVPR